MSPWSFQRYLWDRAGCCSLLEILVALAGLVLVLGDVLLLQLAHALDFVQVDHEALVIAVKRLDALPAEDGQMVATVEVLHALGVDLAQFLAQALLIFILEVEAGLG